MKVTLYTDGAARGNPDGPGGYGAVLQFIDKNGVGADGRDRGT